MQLDILSRRNRIMWITIAQIIVYVLWLSFTIYSYFNLKKKIKNLANTNEITVPFQCKKCQTIHQYTFDEYLKTIRKVRNTTTVRINTFPTGSIVRRAREYKDICKTCNSKQWLILLKIHVFSDTSCEQEHRKLVFSTIIQVVICSFLTVFFFIISENI